ncbi:MAG: hypothetical protein LR008_00745 [Candidatus Pacebacteria bacterium]|nr:hypothetical protein [Candidatus Paceibacterota bacterium]
MYKNLFLVDGKNVSKKTELLAGDLVIFDKINKTVCFSRDYGRIYIGHESSPTNDTKISTFNADGYTIIQLISLATGLEAQQTGSDNKGYDIWELN